VEILRAAPAPEGRVEGAESGAAAGAGDAYVIRDTGQEALLAARARLARFKVAIAERPFSAGGADYPAGSWIVPRAQPGLDAALGAAARELALDARAVTIAKEVARHDSVLPRLGVWVPWADTDEMGWIR